MSLSSAVSEKHQPQTRTFAARTAEKRFLQCVHDKMSLLSL
jgi:hypothetical protein